MAPLLALAVAILFAACSDGAPHASAPRPAERVIADVQWDTLFLRGGASDDTLFGQLAVVEAVEDGVALGDFADGEILNLADDGSLRWTFGRQGRGPGEFSRISDIEPLDDGAIAVLDPDNSRITLITAGGTSGSEIALTDLPARAYRFVTLADGRFLLWTMSPDAPLVILDGGSVVERAVFPWEGYADIHPMAAQGEMDREPGTDRWAVAFTFGDRWVASTGTAQDAVVGLYPDSVPWPVIETTGDATRRSTGFAAMPTWTGLDVSIDDGVVHVLAVDSAGDRRVIDRYDAGSGRYLDSWIPPGSPAKIDVRGARLYAIYNSPFPGIIALEKR